MPQENSDIIVGRNAVREVFRSGKQIDKLLVQSGLRDGSISELLFMAREKKIPVSEVPRTKLAELCTAAGCSENSHQGIAAYAAVVEYAELDELFALARERGEKPFFVMADGVSDPHNLGALIRCCEAAGAHGIIIPKHNAAGIGASVMKSSAGAAAYTKICRVTNLVNTVSELKEQGVWMFACEAGGNDYTAADYDTPLCLVLGSEGKGVSRLLKEKCDFLISIPMLGHVNSLNVSCAGAVMMYGVLSGRSAARAKAGK